MSSTGCGLASHSKETQASEQTSFADQTFVFVDKSDATDDVQTEQLAIARVESLARQLLKSFVASEEGRRYRDAVFVSCETRSGKGKINIRFTYPAEEGLVLNLEQAATNADDIKWIEKLRVFEKIRQQREEESKKLEGEKWRCVIV